MRDRLLVKTMDTLTSISIFERAGTLAHTAHNILLAKGPDTVTGVHEIVASFIKSINHFGLDSVEAAKEAEESIRKKVEDFAARHNYKLAGGGPYASYKAGVDKLLQVMGKLSEVPNEKYNDPVALLGALAQAFPEPPVNPLRKAAAVARQSFKP